MAAEDTSYDLQVFYSVTRADDIDILEEGLYARDRYSTPTAALGDLGRFIRENGGPDSWDEIDQYEISSCWLPHGGDTEISYHARLDRVTAVEAQIGTPPVAKRRPALLTWVGSTRPASVAYGATRPGKELRRQSVERRDDRR